VPTLDINQIMEVLPHRFPMLMVDRIVDYETGVRSVGLKNVTMNEAHFQGHYPGQPIMPGVLMIEFMAQSGAVILLTDPKFRGMTPVIGSIDDVRFRRPVVPGDQLIATVTLERLRGTIGWMKAVATVGEEVAAEMVLTFKLLPSGGS
jgi:beta-hydroxyacyl-ACP dehydratase FabZ